MEPEEWRQISEFPAYFVSSLGRVKGPKKLRKLQLTSKGYHTVDFYVGGISYQRQVHVLVCEAFHGPKPHKDALALHWDDVKTNNIPSNLRWGTYSDNMVDRMRNREMRERVGL